MRILILSILLIAMIAGIGVILLSPQEYRLPAIILNAIILGVVWIYDKCR